MSLARKAFTLVELLVVIAIIGILVSLLLPAVQAAREAARRTSCANNLMQLSIAVQNYAGAHEVYPTGVLNPAGPVLNQPAGYHHNWLGQILPYIEQQNTYQHIDFSVGVYDRKNRPVRDLTIAVFACASEPWTKRKSSYAGCHHDVEAPIDADNHGVFFLNSRLRYEDISDGSSQTIFLGEKRSEARPADLGWMSGTRATLRNTGTPMNATGGKGPQNFGAYGNEDETDADYEEMQGSQKGGSDAAPPAGIGTPAGAGTAEPQAAPPSGAPGAAAAQPAQQQLTYVGGFGSYHPGGAQFAFGDGSVRFLSQTINPQVYQQLGHRADGKLLDSEDF